jgi:hypothetical protein
MFRLSCASERDLAAFQEDGYVVFPQVLTDSGRQGLLDEVLRTPAVVEFLRKDPAERASQDRPHRLHHEPWNDKGACGMALFDAPLVRALLGGTIEGPYHFCHSAVRVSLRESRGLGYHHDNLPVGLAEGPRAYVQMLYYPTGFGRGDGSLSVIPGSQRIRDFGAYAPYGPPPHEASVELLDGLYREQLGQPLVPRELELPPGSMVFMDARTLHAVSPKPSGSEQALRVVVNYVFKQPGSLHRNTQVIPAAWLKGASPERLRLFQRPAFCAAMEPPSARAHLARYLNLG